MTLTDFLEARLAEDAAAHTPLMGRDRTVCIACRDEHGYPIPEKHPVTWPCRPHREVEAKRAIVARHIEEYPGGVCNHCVEPLPCPDLRDLTSVYADHSDYREEWTR